MNVVDIIEKKRDGGELTQSEIEYMIYEYINGIIPDYQMSAFLMAVYFKGMTDDEVYNLTKTMISSGDMVDLSLIDGFKVDKHSTGGVGDKVTLIIGPILASLGYKFPKLSGRGLGHTGGTIDKIESFKGFDTSLTINDFIKKVNEIGISISGQTKNLVLADKLLYALRDVTGTVPSIPLIASSIMSKKLALGADLIMLDVKVGSGAFMKNIDDARKLSITMVNIGKRFGKNVIAMITSMNSPLGCKIGNSLEAMEAIEFLKGNSSADLKEICYEAVAHALMIHESITKEESVRRIDEVIKSGKALNKFYELIKSQHGDINSLTLAKKHVLKSKEEGYIKNIDAKTMGIISMRLGAGRNKLGDTIDHSVGINLLKKPGDYVKAGENLVEVYYNLELRDDITNSIYSAYTFANTKYCDKLILDIIK